MHIITKRRLREFIESHPDARPSLTMWARITESTTWQSIHGVRESWPSADAVGQLTVFNISGNHYRLITYIDYAYGKVFIRHILTHAEYDRERWKDDPWF